MNRFIPGIAVLLCVSLLDARTEKVTCSTYDSNWRSELHLHRQSERRGLKRARKQIAIRAAGEHEVGGKSVRPDIGQIAVLDDADGVVSRRNPFNLQSKTLRFLPAGSTQKYRFELGAESYDAVTADAGTQLRGLGDDDTQEIAIPFPFPFFGQQYRSVFVNSDGNLTFGSGDVRITDRSLGRLNAGRPRIAPLFSDLDPTRVRSGGIKVTSDADRFVVSWVNVPEYSDSGTGPLTTFQVRMYPDGRIEYAYFDVLIDDAVVGIAPGALQGTPAILSFTTTSSGEYPSTIAERFAGSEEIDIFAAAQKFYLNHEDSYDYLVFFNTLGISAGENSVAYETTVRNNRSGYGDPKTDIGAEAGSKRRLQAIMNMGQLSQYPKDPNAFVPARLSARDTPLSVIAHEAGHLFLAFASVRDQNDPDARPMLGYQFAHWSFVFNSEASLLEGNRIRDDGPNASPRFTTTATVEGYSALDQYLMGFRAPEDVPDTFVVTNPRGATAESHPRLGVAFNGERRDIRIADVIQAEGRRTPDHTVSQRKFRFAFILITANGAEPTAENMDQIENYRREFETYFGKVTSGNAAADTALKRSLKVSTFPAAGVVEGGTATATITLESPATTSLAVLLRSTSGAIETPPSVTIPAGSTQAQVIFRGRRPGTDELIAEPQDSAFETVHSRVQVSPAGSLRLSVMSGNFQQATPGSPLPAAVQFRVSDINELPYPGVPIQIAVAGGGSVNRTSATTDENGIASFTWTNGRDPIQELRAILPNGAAIVATALAKPAFAATSVVNAASFAAGLSPGGIATIFGGNLAGSTVPEIYINGHPAQVLYSSPRQVNFYVPVNAVSSNTAEMVVRTSAGTSDTLRVPVATLHPGIFFDTASGYGAILVAGAGQTSAQRPVRAGDVIEIYATGLGPVQPRTDGLSQTVSTPRVAISGIPADVLFSGLAPGFTGLYQINVRVPQGVSSGVQSLRVSVENTIANDVKVQVN